MWNTGENNKAGKLLLERCPGLEQHIIEELSEDTYYNNVDEVLENLAKPWYAVVDLIGEYRVYGENTKEDLNSTLLLEKVMDIVAIFHDGKEVKWELKYVIED